MKRGWRCCSPGCGTSVTDRASEAHQPLGFAFAVIPQSGLAAEVGPAIVAPPEIDESDPRHLGEEERIATQRRDRWPIEKRPLRSEERRGGKAGVNKGRSRGSAYH